MPPVGSKLRIPSNALFSEADNQPSHRSAYKWPLENPARLLAPFPLGTAPARPVLDFPYGTANKPVLPTPPSGRADPPQRPPLIDLSHIKGPPYTPGGLLDLNLLDFSSWGASTPLLDLDLVTSSSETGLDLDASSSNSRKVSIPGSNLDSGKSSRPESRVYDLGSGKAPKLESTLDLGFREAVSPEFKPEMVGASSAASSKNGPLTLGNLMPKLSELNDKEPLSCFWKRDPGFDGNYQLEANVSAMKVALIVLSAFWLLFLVQRIFSLVRSRK